MLINSIIHFPRSSKCTKESWRQTDLVYKVEDASSVFEGADVSSATTSDADITDSALIRALFIINPLGSVPDDGKGFDDRSSVLCAAILFGIEAGSVGIEINVENFKENTLSVKRLNNTDENAV